MHPDLKVGLALAMLIVGFAGAMCFRHRPLDAVAREENLPIDADLDAEMELLPVRTYSPEPKTDDDGADTEPDAEVLPTTDGELVIPEPIATTTDANPAVTGDGTAATGESTAGGDSAASTYVVRSGDTLSGIASRLLGSTQRYDEIFEANRHQLNSPDDLRPGMELVIPPKVKPADSAPAEAEQAETVAADGTIDEGGSRAEPTPAAAQSFTPIVPR